MKEIVTIIVVASRQPGHKLTGTLTVRAKSKLEMKGHRENGGQKSHYFSNVMYVTRNDVTVLIYC